MLWALPDRDGAVRESGLRQVRPGGARALRGRGEARARARRADRPGRGAVREEGPVPDPPLLRQGCVLTALPRTQARDTRDRGAVPREEGLRAVHVAREGPRRPQAFLLLLDGVP